MKKIPVTWHTLPREIQEKMLEHQEIRDESVFIKDLTSTKDLGGFSWSEFEGYHFWHDIILKGYFDDFYIFYPRKNLIKPEYETLYRKTFRVNRIVESQIDLEKIRELNLEHILNIPQSN